MEKKPIVKALIVRRKDKLRRYTCELNSKRIPVMSAREHHVGEKISIQELAAGLYREV